MTDLTAELRGLLKKHALRATTPRLAVLAALHERAAPMTHDEVMEALPDGFDKASVWRVLAQLGELGLLRRMDLGDRIWRYELHDACRSVDSNHGHFRCEACEVVTCLPALTVAASTGELPAALLGAEVRVQVTGRCAACCQSG